VNHDLYIHAGIYTRGAKSLENPTGRLLPGRLIPCHFDDDNPSFIEVLTIFGAEINVKGELFVERFHPRIAKTAPKASDNTQLAAPKDHLDLAIAYALDTLARETDDHAITIKGASGIFRCYADATSRSFSLVIGDKADSLPSPLTERAHEDSTGWRQAKLLSVPA
jgi:hypothetical protein